AELMGLLADTHRVGRLTRGPVRACAVFEAAPWIREPLCRPGQIAAGEAAARLDPLCGDGTGFAVRSAILAASVIDGISRGRPVGAALRPHRHRLHLAFAQHLRTCLAFYTTAGFDASWTAEREHTTDALSRLEAKLARWRGFKLALQGIALTPVGAPAG